MNDSLVSIIIPAYNTEKYIENCLRSITNQTYNNLEIIVIDDGSTDETYKLCKSWENKDERLRIIKKSNTGVSDTRNIGIKLANGKYIVFIDSDDYVSDDYVETLVDNIGDAQMVCGEYYYVINGKIVTHNSYLDDGSSESISNIDAVNLMHKKNSFQGYLWNKIFLKNIILDNNIFFETDVKIWEDMLFCIQYLSKIEKVFYYNKPIYYYIKRENSALNSGDVWQENTQLKAIEKMYKISEEFKGSFYKYIRDYYANYLVGLLGKGGYQKENQIRKLLCKIEELKAKLSIKHLIKYFIYRCVLIRNKKE